MTGFIGSGWAGRPGRAGLRGPLALLGSIALSMAAVGCTGSSATPETTYTTLPQASTSPTVAPTAGGTTAATATSASAPTPAPTLVAAPGPCNASTVDVTIQGSGGIYWQGGAGHKLATLVLKNTGGAPCNLKAKGQPLLLNGDDSILILGKPGGDSATLTLSPGGSVRTLVQTSNLCGAPAIIPPVKVAFMMPGGTGLIVATPPTPTDTEGVPPCMGDPSVYKGSISMDSWAP